MNREIVPFEFHSEGLSDAADASAGGILPHERWTQLAISLHLTPRELDVVKKIVDGRKETALATELGISTHTVHSHLARLYRKLGVEGRCGLLVKVFETYVRTERAGCSISEGSPGGRSLSHSAKIEVV